MWSSELQQTIIQRCKAVQYRLQEPLSRHTSFRIGGPAAVMAFPKTTEELKQLLQGAARSRCAAVYSRRRNEHSCPG